MFNKFVKAIQPFGLALIIFCGAAQAGWVIFTNNAIVGITTVGIGTLLIINHVVLEITRNTIKQEK
jgi:hypothetical protein